MYSKKKIKKLIENLLDDTINADEHRKAHNKIENILNFLREKEIREEIERRWEEIEKQKRDIWQNFMDEINKDKDILGGEQFIGLKQEGYENLYGIRQDFIYEPTKGEALTSKELIDIYNRLVPNATEDEKENLKNIWKGSNFEKQKQGISAVKKAIDLKKKQTACFTKIFSICTSNDNKVKSKSVKLIRLGTKIGFDGLFKRNTKAWKKQWDMANVVIKNDLETAKTIRFNMYHLMICAPQEPGISVPARSLSGEGYRGHIFWDADIFILPLSACTRSALSNPGSLPLCGDSLNGSAPPP